MRSEAFFKSSQEIVKKFLSNVVAIDDRLSFKSHMQNLPVEVEDDFDAIEEDSSGIGTVDAADITLVKTAPDKQDHDLDYQDLSLAFGEYGINCSGFIPDPLRFGTIENAATKIMESARRADITILDWDMDDGFTLPEVTAEIIVEEVPTQPVEKFPQGPVAAAMGEVEVAAAVPEVPAAPLGALAGAMAAEATPAEKTLPTHTKTEQIGAGTGALAKASIKKILEQDQSQHGRLRLMVIYTAEPHRPAIAEDVYKLFSDGTPTGISANLNDCSITFTTSGLEFCKIVVIEKKPLARELREEVIALFTELTTGLLSNATLSALGALRDNTHHILHTFNKHLDPAYMTHVLRLLSLPEVREKAHEVAFDYATDLISEELKSNLQINEDIKENLGNDRLQKWAAFVCKSTNGNTIGIKLGNNPIQITSERLQQLLKATTEEQLLAALVLEPKISKSIEKFETGLIEIDLQGAPGFHHENLSAIECKRRDIHSIKGSNTEPTIKLGSIIRQGEKYYICMQPLCDTVRISEDCNFVFLEITKVGDNGKFTHVIKDAHDSFLKFNIKPDSKKLHVFTFSPDKDTNTIKAVREGEALKVKDKKHDGVQGEFIWLGELKNNIAQSISNSLSAQISRVGLDTNEWLRKRH